MRTVKIEDKKILDLLSKKSEISKRQVEITDEIRKLETEFNKNISKYARIDEKARPLIRKLAKEIEMGEFEQIARVAQDDKDMNWYIEIADRLAELKERLKQDKKNA